MPLTDLISRPDRLIHRLEERGLDALLVTRMVDVRYLTGFTGSNGLAVVGPGSREFVTDFRYVEQAAQQVADFERRRVKQDLFEALPDALPDRRPLRLGFDDEDLSVRRHQKLAARLGPEIELIAAGGLVDAERRVKEPEEVEAIRGAAALVDEIYAWIVERGLVGRTERAVAVELEHEMRRRGADGPSFPSIVASGEHSALPHAEPRDVEIAAGTLVTVDIGCVLDGYCSDGTRTFAAGGVESLEDDARAVYELVLRAQEAALDALRPGISGRDADAVAREIIAADGHAEHFGHGLGHGVGLEVHEGPRLARVNGDPLVAGNVVTVEPGVYLPGRFGVRIEDLVVVTEEGRDVLSGFTKELLGVE